MQEIVEENTRMYLVTGGGEFIGSHVVHALVRAGERAAVIPRLIEAALEGRAPVIVGDGERHRIFIHVHDVVRATLLAAKTPYVSGTMLNVGTGRRTTLNELVTSLSAIRGRSVQPVYAPSRPGDPRTSLMEATLPRARHGFVPSISPSAGLTMASQPKSVGHRAGQSDWNGV